MYLGSLRLALKRFLPKPLKHRLHALYRLWLLWGDPFLPLGRLLTAVPRYVRFLSSWSRYAHMRGAEPLRFGDGYPCLFDAVTTTPFSGHYFHQAVWAMERISHSRVESHVDVGSEAAFVGMLTTHLPVTFLDIRPLRAELPGLTCLAGSILSMPFRDGSISSLSCLHVLEHIGLGRYGDPLDPQGTRLACAELARVLAPGGNLFVSLPVGRPRVCFNAHRVHRIAQVIQYFPGLNLVEFSAVNDRGQLLLDVPMEEVETADYACGLFWFRRTG